MKKYYFRKCDVCNKGMSKGIYAEGSGSEYFCSEDCIKKDWDNTTFYISHDKGFLTYSMFIKWLEDTDNLTPEKDNVYEWFNGCAEWYLGDQWDVVFDINGIGYDVDKVLEEEIIEGDE